MKGSARYCVARASVTILKQLLLSGTVSPFRAEQGTSLETPWRARASFCQEVVPRGFSLTSLAPHERLPEILVVPGEKTPTGTAAQGSSILACRILWTEEPGDLQSIGSHSQTRRRWEARLLPRVCGASGGFFPRHYEDLREPLVRRQGMLLSRFSRVRLCATP